MVEPEFSQGRATRHSVSGRVHMFVGIDVAKAELVVSVLPNRERFTVANDERGVRTLVERLRR